MNELELLLNDDRPAHNGPRIIRAGPEHPFYEEPRPAEKVCIRPACIEFPCCEDLLPDGVADGEPADIARKLGHGAISEFRRRADARYEISGEFGTVFVNAERPLLKIKEL